MELDEVDAHTRQKGKQGQAVAEDEKQATNSLIHWLYNNRTRIDTHT